MVRCCVSSRFELPSMLVRKKKKGRTALRASRYSIGSVSREGPWGVTAQVQLIQPQFKLVQPPFLSGPSPVRCP